MSKYVFLIVFVSAFLGSQAQYNKNNDNGDKPSVMDKLYFSGGGGLGAGSGPYGAYSYYSILPTIGYRIKPEFLAGVNLMYSKYSYTDLGVSYEQFGYAPFLRYYFEQFFIQAEYDRISSLAPNDRTIPRQYYDRFLVGAGYAQPVGRRSALNAMAMYDLLYKTNGVFSSPWVIRVFFSF